MQGHSTFVKIPRERIGVLIGTNGTVRELIEKKLSVNLEIDSQSGDVTITVNEAVNDPSLLFKAKDIVTAIGRGFSPENVLKLIENEEYILEIIDLREIFGRSESDISRIKGRIIGREGKTRRTIEEMTGAVVSVYGHTVSMIGGIEQVDIAREAVRMLLKGSQHKTVYRFLQRKRHELKMRSLELWQSDTPRDLGV
ncbi:MAG: KH domain-containing protein [Candidatus Bathyarchaeota archaeon]|nr:KH domain-containing protein [Candidatus Bathyarchaeota archaeon]